MHQIELDGKITNLVQDMQALYAFLKATDPSKYDETQNKIVTSLAQQTIECAYFIREYADPNFRKFYFILLHGFLFTGLVIVKRTGMNLIFDADKKIQDFQNKFEKLRTAFQQHATCEIQLELLQISNTVKKLGKSYHFFEILQLMMSFRCRCRSQVHELY